MTNATSSPLTTEAWQRARRQLDTRWYRPVRSRRPPHEAAFWQSLAPVPFALEGLPVDVRSAGSGPAVLLLHGFRGRGSQFHRMVRALVCQGFRALLLDMPGYGDVPVERLSVSDIARIVTLLVEEAGGVHAVVTHSIASVWCLFALADGLRPQRVVCLNGVYDVALCYRLFQSLHRLSDAEMRALEALQRAQEGDAMFFRQNPQWVLQHLAPRERSWPPALILHTEDDTVVPVAHGRQLAHHWPASAFRSFPHGEHNGLLTDDAAQCLLTAFLMPKPTGG